MSDVTRDITLPVEPDEAWEALLEPGWLGEEAELDPREGGVGALRRRRRATRRRGRGGRARRAARLLVVGADERGMPDTAGSRVAFELDPVPGGTRVTVRESLTGPVRAGPDLVAA